MIDEAYIVSAIDFMKSKPINPVEFDRGLSESELVEIEQRFEFQFPPDLRLFLQTAIPVRVLSPWRQSSDFPNWRDEPDESLRYRLEWPLDGLLFDVQYNHLWQPEWGERPSSLEDALEIARMIVKEAPKLIPVYGHRFIPAEPCLPDNQVLSVYQTDIICYGVNLPAYLRVEFDVPLPDGIYLPQQERPVRFWQQFVG